MRINVYSQELTPEVIHIEKTSNTGIVYHAAQLVLASSEKLHHPPMDDDRSAVTFWLPKSTSNREKIAKAFDELARIFRQAPLVDPVDTGRTTGFPDYDHIIESRHAADEESL